MTSVCLTASCQNLINFRDAVHCFKRVINQLLKIPSFHSSSNFLREKFIQSSVHFTRGGIASVALIGTGVWPSGKGD